MGNAISDPELEEATSNVGAGVVVAQQQQGRNTTGPGEGESSSGDDSIGVETEWVETELGGEEGGFMGDMAALLEARSSTWADESRTATAGDGEEETMITQTTTTSAPSRQPNQQQLRVERRHRWRRQQQQLQRRQQEQDLDEEGTEVRSLDFQAVVDVDAANEEQKEERGENYAYGNIGWALRRSAGMSGDDEPSSSSSGGGVRGQKAPGSPNLVTVLTDKDDVTAMTDLAHVENTNAGHDHHHHYRSSRAASSGASSYGVMSDKYRLQPESPRRDHKQQRSNANEIRRQKGPVTRGEDSRRGHHSTKSPGSRNRSPQRKSVMRSSPSRSRSSRRREGNARVEKYGGDDEESSRTSDDEESSRTSDDEGLSCTSDDDILIRHPRTPGGDLDDNAYVDDYGGKKRWNGRKERPRRIKGRKGHTGQEEDHRDHHGDDDSTTTHDVEEFFTVKMMDRNHGQGSQESPFVVDEINDGDPSKEPISLITEEVQDYVDGEDIVSRRQGGRKENEVHSDSVQTDTNASSSSVPRQHDLDNQNDDLHPTFLKALSTEPQFSADELAVLSARASGSGMMSPLAAISTEEHGNHDKSNINNADPGTPNSQENNIEQADDKWVREEDKDDHEQGRNDGSDEDDNSDEERENNIQQTIDLDFVEKYDAAFHQFLRAHPHFMKRNPDLTRSMKVAKLQRLMEVSSDVERTLTDHIPVLQQQKQDMAATYYRKLREATKKKATQQVHLQEQLAACQRATLLTKAQMTWSTIVNSATRVQHHSRIIHRLQNEVRVDDPNNLTTILPKPQLHEVQAIHDALKEVSAGSSITSSDGDGRRQLQRLRGENHQLYQDALVLESRLAAQRQCSKKCDWVDQVYARLDPPQMKQLKHRYQQQILLQQQQQQQQQQHMQ